MFYFLCQLWDKYKNHFQQIKRKEGNVLFIILLCVALFAALGFAVTGSMRSGGGDASREQSILLASQVTQYGTSIQTAIIRMKISNGCTDNDIDFYMPTVSALASYIHTPDTRDECKVFHPSGGNVPYQNMQLLFPSISMWDQNIRVTGGSFFWTGAYCSSESCYDLILLIKIPEKVCQEIANKFGTIEANGSIVHDSASINEPRFQGVYATGSLGNIIGDDAGNQIMKDKPVGCFYSGLGAPYTGWYYYNVLIQRGI